MMDGFRVGDLICHIELPLDCAALYLGSDPVYEDDVEVMHKVMFTGSNIVEYITDWELNNLYERIGQHWTDRVSKR